MLMIKVEIRNVFGTAKAYPACDTARLFARIAGTKTLTQDAIRSILAMGYQIQTLGTESRIYRPGLVVDLPTVQ